MLDTLSIIPRLPRLLRRRAEWYEYAINSENPAPGSDGEIIAWTQAQRPEGVLA